MDEIMSRDFAILRRDLEGGSLSDAWVLSLVALLAARSRIGCEDHAELATRDVRGCSVVCGECDVRQPREENHPSAGS